MSKPLLYTNGFSPSAKRVVATLAHKGIDYEPVEVDITQKQRPADFSAASLFGKVPTLVHEGRNIIESVVICEYLDEVWPEPAMMPSDPKDRAYARQWMMFANRVITDRDGEFVHIERDQAAKMAICRKIFPDLKVMDDELAGKSGLFLGPELSLVDVVIAPFTRILGIWADIVEDPNFAGYRNIHAYFDRLGAHPTLAKAVYDVPDDAFRGFFDAVLKEGLTIP